MFVCAASDLCPYSISYNYSIIMYIIHTPVHCIIIVILLSYTIF
jgi:hypothetical protein